MTLADYLRKRHITQRDFAEKIGVAQQHISYICEGGRPSATLAKKIEEETDRGVSRLELLYPNEFVESK